MACRACRVYLSEDKEKLNQEDQTNLRNLTKYLCQVYFPNWFNIKVHSNIEKGAENFLFMLKLYENWNPIGLKTEVFEKVEENLKKNSYWAGSEKIILSLVTSDDPRLRQQGVQLILRIRGEEEFSDFTPKDNVYPDINFEAKTLVDLLKPEDFNKEPSFTSHLTKEQINALVNEKLIIDKIPGHSQGCERMIRRMDETTSIYWSNQRQTDHIRARQFVKRTIPASHPTKRDLISLVETDFSCKRRKGEDNSSSSG